MNNLQYEKQIVTWRNNGQGLSPEFNDNLHTSTCTHTTSNCKFRIFCMQSILQLPGAIFSFKIDQSNNTVYGLL